jgi:hypothetical protein
MMVLEDKSGEKSQRTEHAKVVQEFWYRSAGAAYTPPKPILDYLKLMYAVTRETEHCPFGLQYFEIEKLQHMSHNIWLLKCWRLSLAKTFYVDFWGRRAAAHILWRQVLSSTWGWVWTEKTRTSHVHSCHFKIEEPQHIWWCAFCFSSAGGGDWTEKARQSENYM